MLNHSAFRPRFTVAALAIAALAFSAPASAQGVNLKDKLDSKAQIAKDAAARTADERVLSDAIRDFYSRRDFKPLWFEGDAPSAQAKA
ncbi:MAG: hypothetical protein ACREIP_10120, partial [Alphaproteobacteria bacterium]